MEPGHYPDHDNQAPAALPSYHLPNKTRVNWILAHPTKTKIERIGPDQIVAPTFRGVLVHSGSSQITQKEIPLPTFSHYFRSKEYLCWAEDNSAPE